MWHVVGAADREGKGSAGPPRLTPVIPSVSYSAVRGAKVQHLSNDVNLVQHPDITG